MGDERILLVEDDLDVRTEIVSALSLEGYVAISANNQAEAIAIVRKEPPDLIILDLNPPVSANLEACHSIRCDCSIPVVVLSSTDNEFCRVAVLEAGADYCMAKPIAIRELLARIRSLLWRSVLSGNGDPSIIHLNDFSIDMLRRTVTVKGHIRRLTPREFDLLVYLVSNKNSVISRRQLFTEVWGRDAEANHRTLDVHVRWLRQKLENDPDEPKTIVTVRNLGYKLVCG